MIRIAAVGDIHCGLDPAHLRPRSPPCRTTLICSSSRATSRDLEPQRKRPSAQEIGRLGVPTVAVLGNHDYQAGRQEEIVQILTAADVKVLDGTSTTLEVGGCRVGIAGVKGFGGGFVGVCATEFGEPEMKLFVQQAERQAAMLVQPRAAHR